MGKNKKRLLVVSNRLPVAIDEINGVKAIRPATGGLVTALNPVMQENQGLWIGWLGTENEAKVEELLRNFSKKHKYSLKNQTFKLLQKLIGFLSSLF